MRSDRRYAISAMSKSGTNRVWRSAVFRFYAELKDFLPSDDPVPERFYRFQGKPSVKDAIEAQGIPHTEVGLILVGNSPVDFGHHLREGERIAVYPEFKGIEIPGTALLREPLGRDVRFVLDVHLGKLARWLRLCGFDAVYRNDFDDAEVAGIASGENRVALTRDRRLLFRREIEHGYWVRSGRPDDQVAEVLSRYRLENRICLFQRCLQCNGLIRPVSKPEVYDRLEPLTRVHFHSFRQCTQCGKVYWKGSHYDRMMEKLRKVLGGG